MMTMRKFVCLAIMALMTGSVTSNGVYGETSQSVSSYSRTLSYSNLTYTFVKRVKVYKTYDRYDGEGALYVKPRVNAWGPQYVLLYGGYCHEAELNPTWRESGYRYCTTMTPVYLFN